MPPLRPSDAVPGIFDGADLRRRHVTDCSSPTSGKLALVADGSDRPAPLAQVLRAQQNSATPARFDAANSIDKLAASSDVRLQIRENWDRPRFG